jgi:hypothetical protein
MSKKNPIRFNVEPWLHYGRHRLYRFTGEDVLEEDLELLTPAQITSLNKDVLREKRLSRHMRSRERDVRDHCGATFHQSKRNQGRKPRKDWEEE